MCLEESSLMMNLQIYAKEVVLYVKIIFENLPGGLGINHKYISDNNKYLGRDLKTATFTFFLPLPQDGVFIQRQFYYIPTITTVSKL